MDLESDLTGRSALQRAVEIAKLQRQALLTPNFPRAEDTLKAKEKTPLDYATEGITSVMNRVLPTDRFGRQFRDDRTREFLDYFTPVGSAEALYQGGKSLASGDYGSAALLLPLAVLSAVPGAAFARKPLREGSAAVEDALRAANGDVGTTTGDQAVQRAVQLAQDNELLGRAIETAPLATQPPAPIELPPYAVKPSGGQWLPRQYDPTLFERLDEEQWQRIAPYFEGYAIGGRIPLHRCF